MTDAEARRGRLRDALALVALTIALLLPFADKPLHVDDPLFVATAEQIRRDPLDFYGLEVFWNRVPEPMAVANLNPPGVGYYLAAVSWVGGFGERSLHLGMMVPAIALVLGTMRLAVLIGASAPLAGVLLLSFPAVLVSATSLMTDTLAAALWCWSVVLWIEAHRDGGVARFVGAGLLAAACLLTKYVGLGLVPLFVAHALWSRRRLGAWILAPALACAIALLYRASMIGRYGVDPFALAGSYSVARQHHGVGSAVRGAIVGLSFLGGSFATVGFLAPRLWRRRDLLRAGAVGALFGAAVGIPIAARSDSPLSPGWGASLVVHLGVFIAAGLGIAALIATRVASKQREAWLLGGWILGIAVFASFVNWTTNARSFLPAAPAIAVVLADAIERRIPVMLRWSRVVPIAAGLLLALVVAHADHRLAVTNRLAATELAARYADASDPVRFHGSWGFQHYMQQRGMKKLGGHEGDVVAGTRLVTSAFAGGGLVLPPAVASLVEERRFHVGALASTHHPARGAGFYGSFIGPVPFALGAPPDDLYRVYEIRETVRVDLPDP